MTAHAEPGVALPAARARPDPVRADGASLREPLAVWALFAAAALAVVVTYARLPAAELYHTDVEGIRGGLGRALVFLNFPTALVAIGVAAFVADRARSRLVDALALVAVALCLVVGVPGVVEARDLDAKWVNAVPALGVALALGLTILVLVRRGAGATSRRVRGDAVRVAVAVALVLISIPWLFSELGFYVSDAPVLGALFMGSEVVPEPGNPGIRAVHLGHHHGTDGFLVALAGLALSRGLAGMRRPRLRLAATAWVSLMVVYGLANALQDFWTEQLFKRGTVSFKLPDLLNPALTPGWVAMLAAAAVLYAVLTRPTSRVAA